MQSNFIKIFIFVVYETFLNLLLHTYEHKNNLIRRRLASGRFIGLQKHGSGAKNADECYLHSCG